MTKTQEAIQEVLDKWAGIEISHTEKAIRSVLEEAFGDEVCDEDIKTGLGLLKNPLHGSEDIPKSFRSGLTPPDMNNSAIRLVDFAESESGFGWLFMSEGEPYARVRFQEYIEVCPVRSRTFKGYLTWVAFNHEGKAPGSEVIENAVRLASVLAKYESGAERKLYNRVAWDRGDILYDLSNHMNQAVRVTADGWKVVNNSTLFKRYKHQRPAVMPVPSEGSLKARLERFYDLVNHDPDTRLLHLVELVFSFVPDVPHPIPVVYGEQGSTKTSFFRVCKRLIDPSYLGTMTLPRNTQEIIQKLSHHWFIPFDNITKLEGWQSDALCRAVTGEGFSKRMLYTDDEDFIYNFKRVVGLNGINVAAENPDLLDRAILHSFPAVPPSKRLTEKELWHKFEELAPGLMGAIFDTLSAAMRILPDVDVNGLYRMADFTEWGCAIAQALGYKSQVFLDEYLKNQNIQNREVLDNDPVGLVVFKLWEDYKSAGKLPYEATPSMVYEQFERIAEGLNIKTTGDRWPKSTQAMGRRLNELKTNLKREGIGFESRRTKKERFWTLSPLETSDYCVTSVIPSPTTLEDFCEHSEQSDGDAIDDESSENSVTKKTPLEAIEASGDEVTQMTQFSEIQRGIEEKQSDIPQTPREQGKAVLRLFDPELANNGQTWHIDYIIAEIPELDEAVVRDTVMRLMEGGLLMEVAVGQYRRVT